VILRRRPNTDYSGEYTVAEEHSGKVIGPIGYTAAENEKFHPWRDWSGGVMAMPPKTFVPTVAIFLCTCALIVISPLSAMPDAASLGTGGVMTVAQYERERQREDFGPLNKIYLKGVQDGLMMMNAMVKSEGRKPYFCIPGELAMTPEQAEDIMLPAPGLFLWVYWLDFSTHSLARTDVARIWRQRL
jgi:hypothetical protein